MEEVGFDRLMELGARHVAGGDLDRAIHYYNAALRASPGAPLAYIGLGKAFTLKEKKGEPVFRVLAMDALRKAAAADPASEEAHALLIAAAIRAGKLGDLAVEYREKLKRAPSDAGLKKRLNHIYLISLMDTEVEVPQLGYRPVFFVKVFFDCILLPLSSSIIIAANAVPKARPSLGIGVFIFFCYAVYRTLVWFFLRR